MNLAPHSTACWHWSNVTTVPAPTTMSGTSSATRRMDSGAAAVRKMISIRSTPPLSMAFAVATASSAKDCSIAFFSGSSEVSTYCSLVLPTVQAPP